MNPFYIGTNWKMTKTTKEGTAYSKELAAFSEQLDPALIELFIIPSFPSLVPVKNEINSSQIRLGAQNMHWAERGAYTGEVSPVMLKEIGIDIVELGHSERREYFNENDHDINKKVHAALQYGMKPLVCIGETLEEKENNISVEMLSKQLKVCLKGLEKDQLVNVLIAYEPVWAIGERGIPATPDYVSYIHGEIRVVLTEMYGNEGADVPILFGGSVNHDNYLSYFEDDNVNGLFIGRAAWDVLSFKEILKTCHSKLTSLK
ncbi:triose-phosphate isomerase [Alteribacillus sp. YIM 98480]|uniref:triose-phosphate isomerase n=1 Tax=Alteribacillus sp. YIM 98480 TaxID=2606599 RepID=UPI00131CFC29|nr:triose-phosphate isomerase [Alteribacillus sp. YIM 98480]